MNGPRHRHEKKIFKLYDSKIQDENIKTFGEFLYQYITLLEDENGPLRNFYIDENPLLNLNEVISNNRKYYNLICSRLTKYVKIFTNNTYKHNSIVDLIAYYGFVLEHGVLGFAVDKESAFKYYKISAQYQSPFGTFKLAHCFEKGVGCEKNIYSAIWFYRCAAKLGSLQGLHTFGTILLQNDLNIEFRSEFGSYYLQAGTLKATKHYPFVFFDYARYLESRLEDDDITVNNYNCFQAYFKGAQMECPNCQYRIAECYELGDLDVKIDMQKAFTFYKSAAYNGHVEAQVKIAQTLISKGERVPENFNLAFKYAMKAAIKGNCIAINYVVLFYKKGLGVKKSILISQWWQHILYVHLRQQNIKIDIKLSYEVENIVLDTIGSPEEVCVEECETKPCLLKAA